ncbi:DEAD/DEAH box helicase, partial [Chloroflexota bacterium]
MDTVAFLSYLKALPSYQDQVVHIEQMLTHDARYAGLDSPLAVMLADQLSRKGTSRLYTHQAEAVNSIREGQNVMVATSSASGKTLCYNIAVLQKLLTEPRSRALYLFPAKALAQDQLRNLRDLFSPEPFGYGDFNTFDGDTPREERGEIRKRARIILSNPDMLHLGILPNHRSWAEFLRNLKYVVVDEAHVYRGVFGSHVSCVLRRLRRLCRFYGSDPQFICCSATIANPGEHAEKLTGLPFRVVDDDGSPRGRKDFIFWNPPLLDATRTTRRSANSEAVHLFSELVE